MGAPENSPKMMQRIADPNGKAMCGPAINTLKEMIRKETVRQ